MSSATLFIYYDDNLLGAMQSFTWDKQTTPPVPAKLKATEKSYLSILVGSEGRCCLVARDALTSLVSNRRGLAPWSQHVLTTIRYHGYMEKSYTANLKRL